MHIYIEKRLLSIKCLNSAFCFNACVELYSMCAGFTYPAFACSLSFPIVTWPTVWCHKEKTTFWENDNICIQALRAPFVVSLKTRESISFSSRLKTFCWWPSCLPSHTTVLAPLVQQFLIYRTLSNCNTCSANNNTSDVQHRNIQSV